MADQEWETLRNAREAYEQKTLRGKSARQIEMLLSAEAKRNISQSQEISAVKKTIHREVRVVQDGHHQHAKLMNERVRNVTEDLAVEPLRTLQHELKNYEQKSAGYFLDKRYPSMLCSEFGV